MRFAAHKIVCLLSGFEFIFLHVAVFHKCDLYCCHMLGVLMGPAGCQARVNYLPYYVKVDFFRGAWYGLESVCAGNDGTLSTHGAGAWYA